MLNRLIKSDKVDFSYTKHFYLMKMKKVSMDIFLIYIQGIVILHLE